MLCPNILISMPGGSEWFLMSIFIFIPLYFLPTIIARNRKNPSSTGIFFLNLLLGWTVIGWIGALAWALSSERISTPTVIVNNTSQLHSPAYKSENPDISQQTHLGTSTTKLTTHQDKIDQLRQFKQLLDEGIITNEEFEKQKAAILG